MSEDHIKCEVWDFLAYLSQVCILTSCHHARTLVCSYPVLHPRSSWFIILSMLFGCQSHPSKPNWSEKWHWKNRDLRNVFISRLKVYTKGKFRKAKGNCELTHTTLEWLSGWHRQMFVVPMRLHCWHPLCLKCQLQLHAKTTHQKKHPFSTLQAFENRYSVCFAADENWKKFLGFHCNSWCYASVKRRWTLWVGLTVKTNTSDEKRIYTVVKIIVKKSQTLET